MYGTLYIQTYEKKQIDLLFIYKNNKLKEKWKKLCFLFQYHPVGVYP